MTDTLQPVLTLAKVKRQLNALGVTISRNSDTQEYRVNIQYAPEAMAYYTTDLADALGTGLDMGARVSRLEQIS